MEYRDLCRYSLYCFYLTSSSADITIGKPYGVVATPIAVRACFPISLPNNCNTSSEQEFITFVVSVNPGATLTKPLITSHASILSKLPSSLFKVLSMDNVANLAEADACSSVTSLPTLPIGPAIVPSGFCGP